MSDAPIGIFDSGVGGLTVARAVRDQLPQESILYIGDTRHSPYGPKPLADVRRFALEVLDDLVEQDVKMLVIACNTASAAMLRDARERYSVPVIEVIQPAVRTAVSVTRNDRVGVIGTTATITSRAYEDAFAAAPHLRLFTQACPEFVEHVEAGDTTSDELVRLAEGYLRPLVEQDIDTLVLGCTHYPFLKGAISYVVGDGVRLVSSDTETANDVYRTLVGRGIQRTSPLPPTYRYEATGESAEEFLRLADRFLGPEVSRVELVETGTITIPARARLQEDHS
ncbi:glutamate racemase [Humibacter sp. BT305]|uniref:Glutamate racemase n=1 Tax=Cnuibacter physcomitrellae TaxID=1619308 RepID=A0A1X9LMD6_9MICO|nr:glutamate racemase [Cnuibacter physcomitrellae]ARJ05642.1 glutamate racemase [Cnuibacter physcomitrellae]AXH35730.1 glutamate racemase [Humibacter sp. BT305]MCS5496655.1 glutamate racemase [Cnuibacter physcomitrellae]GGI36154.1 glutamate racemase [Cnuibacter physcomitrellae]